VDSNSRPAFPTPTGNVRTGVEELGPRSGVRVNKSRKGQKWTGVKGLWQSDLNKDIPQISSLPRASTSRENPELQLT
jgi:hypothetical protein